MDGSAVKFNSNNRIFLHTELKSPSTRRGREEGRMALIPMEQNQGTLKSITASITTNASGSGVLKYNGSNMTTDIQVIQAYIQGYKSFLFPYDGKWYMNVGDVSASGYAPVSNTFNATVWILE